MQTRSLEATFSPPTALVLIGLQPPGEPKEYLSTRWSSPIAEDCLLFSIEAIAGQPIYAFAG